MDLTSYLMGLKGISEIKEAVAKLEAEKNKKFELIEEITTTEEISVISRTKEPDETSYDFEKIKILIKASTDTAIAANIYINSSYAWTGAAITAASETSRCVLDAAIESGMLSGKKIVSSSINAVNNIQSTLQSNLLIADSINKFEIAARSPLPSGTVIQIYAVRRWLKNVDRW